MRRDVSTCPDWQAFDDGFKPGKVGYNDLPGEAFPYPAEPADGRTVPRPSEPLAIPEIGLREAVARAMVARQFNDWDQLDGGEQGYWLEMADAAVQAVREHCKPRADGRPLWNGEMWVSKTGNQQNAGRSQPKQDIT